MPDGLEDVRTFAARVKAAYPDYESVDDYELVSRIATKHPDYRSRIKGFDIQGADELKLSPAMTGHYLRLYEQFEKAGIKPFVKKLGGFRTAEDENYLYRTGHPTMGNTGYGDKISPHQEGRAIDFSFSPEQRARGRQIMAQYASQYGLHIPSSEPWHIAIAKGRGQETLMLPTEQDPEPQQPGRVPEPPSTLQSPKGLDPARRKLMTLTPEEQARLAGTSRRPGQVPTMADVLSEAKSEPYAPSIRQQIAKQVEDEFATTLGQVKEAIPFVGDPVGIITKSRERYFNDEVERRYQAYLRGQDPNVIAGRKVLGKVPGLARGTGSPQLRAGAGVIKALGGVTSLAGLTPNRVSEYLNQKGELLSDISVQPLNAQGEAIVQGLPEKALSAVGDLSISVLELVAIKKATGWPMGRIMAVETALQNTDKPLRDRTNEVAKAYAMGRILDQHLSKPASAVLFGAPTAIETGIAYAQDKMTLEDALLQTGIQTAAGAIMGGKPRGVPESPLKTEPRIDVVPEIPEVPVSTISEPRVVKQTPQTGQRSPVVSATEVSRQVPTLVAEAAQPAVATETTASPSSEGGVSEGKLNRDYDTLERVADERDPEVVRDNFNNWQQDFEWTKLHGTPDDQEMSGALRDAALDRYRQVFKREPDWGVAKPTESLLRAVSPQPETKPSVPQEAPKTVPPSEAMRPLAETIQQRAEQFSALREGAVSGERHALDLTDDLKSAFDRVAVFKQQGAKVIDAVNADQTMTPFQRQTTILLDGEPEIVGKVLDNYLKGAEVVGSPQEKAFFEKSPPTKEALLEAAMREAVRDANQQESSLPESQGIRPEPETSRRVPNIDTASKPVGREVPQPDRSIEVERPAEAVESLVPGPPRNLEAGGIDVDLLTLGVRPFAKDVGSKFVRGAQGIKNIADAVRGILAPSTRSPEATTTALSVRARAAEMERQAAIADRALESAREFFSRQKPISNYEFIDRMERGQPQLDSKTQNFADILRQSFDLRRDQIRSLGTGKLETFIENYFPHLWKDPTRASQVFSQGRRPFEGAKSFLKQRTIPLTSEGLAKGLEPVSDNPVDLAVLRLREMDKYLMAHRVMAEMKDIGTLKFFKMSERLPDGWKQIDDRVSTVFSRGESGEMILRGRYAAPESAAKIINNYLSPGLEATVLREPFKAWRATANFLNQFQLGFSAFHAGFTTLDAAISRTAVGLEDILAYGNPVRGLKTLLSTPISPITNLVQGSKMLREYYSPGSQGAEIQRYVDAMVEGGGRAKQDRFYTNMAIRSFTDALKQGNIIGSALRAPAAAVELLAKPTMEFLVPRQKLGVFAEMAKRELERLGPDASPVEVRSAMSRAWDSVDNRMGQMIYDNLFWHKITKDLAMSSVRSVGWNLGTAREVGGGVVDLARLPFRAAEKGRTDPLFTHRMAYAVALPLVVGTMGAMTQYLLTGKGPDELKDYFFPKTGGVDENGSPERIAFPSYMKDIFPLTDRIQHGDVAGVGGVATHMLTSKAHPLIGMVGEMLSNKDYYGTEIRHPDDPLIQQLKDAASHVATGLVPFAVRGYQKEKERDTAAWRRVLPFVGITPAPNYLNQSEAERLLSEKLAARLPQGSRTKAESERSRLKYNLQSKMRRGQLVGQEVQDAVARGQLTQDDVKAIVAAAHSEPLPLRFAKLNNIEDMLDVYDLMSEVEKAKVRPVLAAKRLALIGMTSTGRGMKPTQLRGTPEEQQALRHRLDVALGQGVPLPPQ